MFTSRSDPIFSLSESCVEKQVVLEVLQCFYLVHLSQISIRAQQGYTQNVSFFYYMTESSCKEYKIFLLYFLL